MSRAIYQQATCVCCGGKWRIQVYFPALKRGRLTKYITAWELQVICGRCNSGDCGGAYIGEIVPCRTGRQD